jgi:hypothetical protein
MFAKAYTVLVKAVLKNLADILKKNTVAKPSIRQKQYPVHPY